MRHSAFVASESASDSLGEKKSYLLTPHLPSLSGLNVDSSTTMRTMTTMMMRLTIPKRNLDRDVLVISESQWISGVIILPFAIKA